MKSGSQATQSDKLIFWGLALFFLGLVIGLFVQQMANPRMGLSAHLEGVMNGLFLMILGLIWNRLALSTIMLKAAYGLALFGTFANIAAVTIAAITGAGKMMAIAGGKEGDAATEAIISFLLVSLSLCMLLVCLIVLTGLYKNMKLQKASAVSN
jgi:hydroxylaminobenzene mutase